MKIEPYLFFNGRCDEAIDFYRGAIGASVRMLMRFDESPEPPPAGSLPPGWGRKVMHAEVAIGSTTLMASDGMHDGAQAFQGFSLALSLPDTDAARQAFDRLAEGGEVRMPMAPTFWSPAFGMLADRYGVGWMVMAE